MDVPDWRHLKAGARIRVALWLHSEVGEGGTFTKAQLREAFPNVEQIDRRMRDLRPEGWVIATYREDRSLAADELRLVREGGAVWERGYASQQRTLATEKERRAAFAADNYRCVVCGIGAGETYPDDLLRTAKLTVSRTTARDGSTDLVTNCDRCHVVRDGTDVDDLLPELGRLRPDQLERFRRWVGRGEREWTPEEQLWARYRRLPKDARDAVRSFVADS